MDFHGGYLSEIFNHPEKKPNNFHGFEDEQKFEPIERNCVDDYSFSRLPKLLCFENGTNNETQRESDLRNSAPKRLRSAVFGKKCVAIDDDDDDESGGCDLRILEMMIPRRLSGSEAARQRRRRISDRTRDLERLMPWTKKMDIAAMLGEAYKYIEFLAAQVQVLRSMPPPPPNQNHECSNFGGEFGRLELMNREQLLHVLMNSPISQTTLCSRKLCLCSIEQFESLMTAAMNKNHLSQ